MASRWRIRHKLLLGVCLVCGLLALLLGGTLNGLWLNYQTMNSIRGKKAELKVAAEFRKDVYDLTRLDRADGAGKGDDDFFRVIDDLPKKALRRESSWRPTRPSCKTRSAADATRATANIRVGTVDALKKDLDKLATSTAKLSKQRMDAAPTDQVEAGLRNEVLEQTKPVVRDADDLYNNINDDIDRLVNDSREHYQVTLWIVVPASVLGMLVMAGLMRSFYAWIFHPIRDLEIGVGRVAKGDFSRRIEVRSGDEMEDLAAAFNDMMDRLRGLYDNLAQQVNERSRQLVRSERLASVGFLAAGVAHEINNPLASIAFCSEALEARLAGLADELGRIGQARDNAEVFGRYLRMIQEEAFRCKNITERLLAFSRTGERRREPTDLARVVQGVLEVTQHLQNAKGKTIVFEPVGGAGKVVASVNREEIKSVVLNLVVNALDSMEEGGRLTIRLTQRVGTAEIQFTDTGCGMTREVLENIFEPFFTRNRTGKGTGLGLTISHSIISQHGGEIEADSAGVNQGSTFVVRLPLQPAEETAAPAAMAA